jgi:hypothetical protein
MVESAQSDKDGKWHDTGRVFEILKDKGALRKKRVRIMREHVNKYLKSKKGGSVK